MFRYFTEEWSSQQSYAEGKIRYRMRECGQIDVLALTDKNPEEAFISTRTHLWYKASEHINSLDLKSIKPGESIYCNEGTTIRISNIEQDFHPDWLEDIRREDLTAEYWNR